MHIHSHRYVPINILLSRADPDYPLRLLEESRKQNYSIRTVKIIQVTLIKQSIVQVSTCSQNNVPTEATNWIHP